MTAPQAPRQPTLSFKATLVAAGLAIAAAVGSLTLAAGPAMAQSDACLAQANEIQTRLTPFADAKDARRIAREVRTGLAVCEAGNDFRARMHFAKAEKMLEALVAANPAASPTTASGGN
jgi:hypothetical protein